MENALKGNYLKGEIMSNASIGAPDGERFVRVVQGDEISPDCGLNAEEMESLVMPTAHNGGKPPLRSVKVEMLDKPPVYLIQWPHLYEHLMKLDPMRSYEAPRAYYKFLVKFPSCHKSALPEGVEMVTEIFQAGEEPQFQKAVDEQLSMNREVWIVYTRKGAAIGFKNKRF